MDEADVPFALEEVSKLIVRLGRCKERRGSRRTCSLRHRQLCVPHRGRMHCLSQGPASLPPRDRSWSAIVEQSELRPPYAVVLRQSCELARTEGERWEVGHGEELEDGDVGFFWKAADERDSRLRRSYDAFIGEEGGPSFHELGRAFLKASWRGVKG